MKTVHYKTDYRQRREPKISIEGLDGLTPDSIYRVCPSMNRKNRQMRDKRLPCSISCQLIIAVKPVTVDKPPEATAKTDPLIFRGMEIRELYQPDSVAYG